LKPGSTILISGSRTGVGRALAKHYTDAGHTVFGLSRGESDFAHPKYHHIRADVTKEETLKPAFAQIAEMGPLQVLIYSSAVNFPGAALLVPTSQAENMLRTNLLGAFLVSRHSLRLMKQGRFGRLIYFSSIAVPLGSAGTAVYGATKAGIEQLAFSLSREFANDNITFNTIGISTYASAMLDAIGKKNLEEARSAMVKSENVQLDELVGAVNFFASDAARQITGQSIYFGGVR
jgi:3-oxoacyl-[acyl-carrier protein] reductase